MVVYRGSRRGVGRYVEGETGRELSAGTAVIVDDFGVVTEVTGPHAPEPAVIASRDRRVVYYVSKVELAIRAQAWRERPITPDPKPKDRRRRRRNA